METVDRFEPAVEPKLNRLPVMKERVRSSKFAKKFVGSGASDEVSGEEISCMTAARGGVLLLGAGVAGIAGEIVPSGDSQRTPL